MTATVMMLRIMVMTANAGDDHDNDNDHEDDDDVADDSDDNDNDANQAAERFASKVTAIMPQCGISSTAARAAREHGECGASPGLTCKTGNEEGTGQVELRSGLRRPAAYPATASGCSKSAARRWK